MKTAGAAGRYAKALFDLAEGPKQKEEFLSQLRALGQAFTDQEELRDVFENPQFDTALKKRIIDQLCAKVSASSMVRNTLCLLADRGRMRELPGMVEAFSELLEESEGRVRAEVITAVAAVHVGFEGRECVPDDAVGVTPQPAEGGGPAIADPPEESGSVAGHGGEEVTPPVESEPVHGSPFRMRMHSSRSSDREGSRPILRLSNP